MRIRIDPLQFSDIFKKHINDEQNNVDTSTPNHFGKVFYFERFECYCVVVKHIDDSRWWFVPENNPRVLKTQTKLSKILNRKDL